MWQLSVQPYTITDPGHQSVKQVQIDHDRITLLYVLPIFLFMQCHQPQGFPLRGSKKALLQTLHLALAYGYHSCKIQCKLVFIGQFHLFTWSIKFLSKTVSCRTISTSSKVMAKITRSNQNKISKIKIVSYRMYRCIRNNQTFKRYVRWWSSAIKTNLNCLASLQN